MSDGNAGPTWPEQIYRRLKASGVTVVSFVPDGGHKRLIQHCMDDEDIKTISLTTEEEGVALAAGVYLAGGRSVLLMQSSGVGNCINMLSLMKNGQFPLLMIVTMRGDFGEENPWQIPMGQATEEVLSAAGAICLRAETAAEVEEVTAAALKMAFNAMQPMALLLSQRIIGAKAFK